MPQISSKAILVVAQTLDGDDSGLYFFVCLKLLTKTYQTQSYLGQQLWLQKKTPKLRIIVQITP